MKKRRYKVVYCLIATTTATDNDDDNQKDDFTIACNKIIKYKWNDDLNLN